MHNGMSSHIIYTEGGTGEGAFALELLNVKGVGYPGTIN